MTLLTGDTWTQITALAQKESSAKVAVAYFGQGASRLLPLKEGSVLVADLSQSAVRSGQSCPQEIIKLIRKGVEVHSCSNLHAKVFAFGRRAIIGSMNVSANSAHSLIEAGIETTDPEVVRSCKDFVDSLRGEHVDLDYACRLAKIYKPPKFSGVKKNATPSHPPFWAVPLEHSEWETEDDEVFEKYEEVARKKLKDQERFDLDKYQWTGGGFRRPLHVGDLVVQVTKEIPKKIMLSPVSRVVLIQRYRVGGEDRMIVFLQSPKLRRKNLKDVKERIGNAASLLKKLANPRLIRNRKSVHQLLQLWPSLKDIE